MENTKAIISDEYQLRPRYGEVDQMGYVYHANYVSYCHQARTELLRKLGVHDSYLEENNIMLPVISFNIDYKKPGRYDELLTIQTSIKELPKTRFNFIYLIYNEAGDLISNATSTLVFVKKDSRQPVVIPDFIKKALVTSKV